MRSKKDTKLIVSASPHVRSDETTRGLMANVIVALCPVVVASAVIFGLRALLVTAFSVVVCVALEWLYCKLLKRPNPVGDLSAVVTGIILAMNVPVGMPLGQIAVGCVAAIIVTKQLFGGIGMNFANPALVGRIVLFVSFASEMNAWVFPDAAVDQLASATPLQVADPARLNLFDLFMGIHGGVLGETCALAIVLGFVYLVVTKTISPYGHRLRHQPLYPEGQAAVRHLPGRRYICHPLLGQLHRGRLLRAAVHEPVGALHQ